MTATATARQPRKTAPAAASPTVPAPSGEPIPLGRLEHREQRHNDWRGIVRSGTTAADLHYNLKACVLIAQKLTLGDELTLFTEDGATMFRLVCVMGDMGLSAMCAVIDVIDLPVRNPDADDLPDGVCIRRAGVGDEQEGYLVIRTEDGLIYNYGNPLFSYSEAKQFIQNHAAVRDGLKEKHRAKANG